MIDSFLYILCSLIFLLVTVNDIFAFEVSLFTSTRMIWNFSTKNDEMLLNGMNKKIYLTFQHKMISNKYTIFFKNKKILKSSSEINT
jgi:hypothetical protein